MHYPPAVKEAGGLCFELVPVSPPTANFDLSMVARVMGDGLHLDLITPTGRLPVGTEQELLNQYRLLLEQAARRPDAPLEEISLVTHAARGILPDLRQAIPEPVYPAVTEAFLRHAAEQPQTAALRQAGVTWDYARLERASRKVAASLIDLGCPKSTVVAIVGEQTFEMIASALGVLRAGGVLLFLDRRYPETRRQVMLEEANAGILIAVGDLRETERWMLDHLKVVFAHTLLNDDVENEPVIALFPRIHPHDPAYIFFTSGTTGKPKGILGQHQGLSHFLAWESETFHIGPAHRTAQLSSLSFDPVLRSIFLPLVTGGTLCLPPLDLDIRAPDAVLAWIREEGISVLHAVPSMAQTWIGAASADFQLPDLRFVLMAGEPLYDELARRWQAVFPGEVINLYGPTETTLTKSCYRVPRPPESGMQPIGQAHSYSELHVLNRRGQPCGIGEPGQIVIRTPFRTLGYLTPQPELVDLFSGEPMAQRPAGLAVFQRGRRAGAAGWTARIPGAAG